MDVICMGCRKHSENQLQLLYSSIVYGNKEFYIYSYQYLKLGLSWEKEVPCLVNAFHLSTLVLSICIDQMCNEDSWIMQLGRTDVFLRAQRISFSVRICIGCDTS